VTTPKIGQPLNQKKASHSITKRMRGARVKKRTERNWAGRGVGKKGKKKRKVTDGKLSGGGKKSGFFEEKSALEGRERGV